MVVHRIETHFFLSSVLRKRRVKVMEKPWYCYLLCSEKKHNRTYVGSTCDVHRRLRQHNGLRSGGARYTRAYRPWRHALVVKGFPDRTRALQFEWAWKHPRRSRYLRQERKTLLKHGLHGVRGRMYVCKKLMHTKPWNCMHLESVTL